ncbi:MAG: hypothetical protein WBA12_12880 [Catalinimonas sp.]
MRSAHSDRTACTPEERRRHPPVPITTGKLTTRNDTLILYDRQGQASVFVRP